MKWGRILLVSMALLLGACQSEEAKKFIQKETTRKEAQRLVEEAMREKGIRVFAGDVSYANIGKTVDTSRVEVEYDTLHEPVYKGLAYVTVDESSSPKLVGVDHLGLANTEGLVHIGSILMEHLKVVASQSIIQEVQPLLDTLPNVTWEEVEPITFHHVEVDPKKLDELLRLYGKNRLASPTVEEAENWLKVFEFPNSESYEPEMWLTFHYQSQLTNEEFESIFEAISQSEALPNEPYFIRVIADSYDETEEPLYNERSNGQGSVVFIGHSDASDE
ncbi:hypothetical protein [Sporosarcina obsidiansis]|uniref:hypothetical protein n=1 Tax=Sporosarcina obsidiansis TaxID=2660748 RepID=UPI00129BEB3E|nr:hypothetical protein [Sporosarcina obsidiansis]